ncbi:MAG: folylpolyglutamate synthase/dihydrofolate synthase family protein [Pseudanabaenaceae cyanobacterium bins.68]|nr:folylpolyglutamate synthase/dihydrofolate synthase family protein [Pseudanabaenaceae cyanobacterium bins.68]
MDINAYLADFNKFGICLGLERIQQLLQDLGNPHQLVPTVHVAGTNGKGSVCALVSAGLTAAGYRVGRYISPHLYSWRERITINGVWISTADLAQALITASQAILPGQMPTQFELLTAAAWWYFAQQQVDIAVIETGLGGRLDATNVIDRPLVTVISSIALDHCQRLGNTVAAIAAEKAGIIKANCPVVLGHLPTAARQVVEQVAQARHSEVIQAYPCLPEQIGLRGEHQLINGGIAIATLNILQAQGWQISPEAISTSLKQTQWPGRLQLVDHAHRQIWLDGAHNLAAAIALRAYFDRTFPGQACGWVIGILTTKDGQGMIKALVADQDHFYPVTVPDHQAIAPELLASWAGKGEIYPNWQASLEAAIATLEPQTPLILCGSLYLVGAYLQTYGDQPSL